MAWIKGNRYLNEEEKQNNATETYNYLIKKGWSLEAICGMLGNMERESTINPGIWQNLDEGNMSVGFGLVQWTPASNYIKTGNVSWTSFDVTDGDGQLLWIDKYTVSTGQWITTADYPMEFVDFKVSKETPDYLAAVFCMNFERAGVVALEERKQYALKWYEFLGGKLPEEDYDDEDGYTTSQRHGFKFHLFRKRGLKI